MLSGGTQGESSRVPGRLSRTRRDRSSTQPRPVSRGPGAGHSQAQDSHLAPDAHTEVLSKSTLKSYHSLNSRKTK